MSVAGANALLAQLDDYAKAHPQEAETVRAFAGFAACGADGAPEPPAKTGITISGDARVGIVVK